MADIAIEIHSVGANHQLLYALIKNQPDGEGRTSFKLGDTRQIADGISIRYDQRLMYEAEAIAEPIFFTIVIALSTSVAGSVAANYIWKNIEPFVPKIKDLRIGKRKVKLSQDDIAKAFLNEIDKLEEEGKGEDT